MMLRDASGYRTHRQVDTREWRGHTPRYHVAIDGVAACDPRVALAEFTAAEHDDPLVASLLCRRAACAKAIAA